MKYFLGIDVGSSKTHALIVDEAGRSIGFGNAGGGNHQGAGYDGLVSVLRQSFEEARAMAGISAGRVAAAGFGVAGYDFPSDRDGHLDAIRSLGLNCPVEVVNDGFNGLLAGATRGIGVNVTSGSSNNCRGRNKEGRIGRIVGNGSTFGEYGGGIEIARRALQMVSYSWTRRNPPTRLTKVLLDATGATDELDLMEGVSNDYYHLYPFLAVDVINTARAGDAAACEILEWAGEELGWLAVAVARQIEMQDEPVEVIQSGSVFQAGALLTEPMRRVVLEHCRKAVLMRLDGPPVVGAVILGTEQAGFDGYAIRDTIVRTAKEMVK